MIPHARIRNELRRLWWRYSPERKDAKKRARVQRGVYKCEACGGITGKVEVDHITDVGPTPGSKKGQAATWDGLMQRLFCSQDGLRAICTRCHQGKRQTA